MQTISSKMVLPQVQTNQTAYMVMAASRTQRLSDQPVPELINEAINLVTN
jgi:hypothetical protein